MCSSKSTWWRATDVRGLDHRGIGDRQRTGGSGDSRSQRAARPAAGRRSTAPPCRASCSRASSSARAGAFTGAVRDRAEALPARRPGGRSSSTRSARSPSSFRASCCACCQEQQIERVGEDHVRQLDVRVIAATNHDLKQECEAGRFRRDLYSSPVRVSDRAAAAAQPFGGHRPAGDALLGPRVAPAELPPSVSAHGPRARAALRLRLAGNIRELRNVIERAVILSPARRSPHRSRARDERPRGSSQAAARCGRRRGSARSLHRQPRVVPGRAGSSERENIIAALNQSGWRVSGPRGAAEILGVKPSDARVAAQRARHRAAALSNFLIPDERS
mgnify:CR=1 FL=1